MHRDDALRPLLGAFVRYARVMLKNSLKFLAGKSLAISNMFLKYPSNDYILSVPSTNLESPFRFMP